MKRYWITVAAFWLVFVGAVFGLWRLLLFVGIPFAAFEPVLWTLLVLVALGTFGGLARQFLGPRSPVLYLVTGASLVVTAVLVVLTFLLGWLLLGDQFVYLMGPVGLIEFAVFGFVCAIEAVSVTARIAMFIDGRRRSALTSAST